MHPDLKALLALQENDGQVAALDRQLHDLEVQEQRLDREREAVEAARDRARESADEEDGKRRELTHKIEAHRSLQERHVAALDGVRKAREAEAAMSQIDITRRALAQEEGDLHMLAGRVTDLRQAADLHDLELEELAQRQRDRREELAAARAKLRGELSDARARRDETAQHVSRSVLSKYERIRGREKSTALYPLRGMACGRCNTAIPLQRRNVIAAGRSIEVCEGCGVLLYATA
ncbi:MAG TPA: hypothetical protein VN677_04505 [Gemmatimonadaceae bacterium]|nr:hypothetical protein [Gemmatimonadaceae bacterium]